MDREQKRIYDRERYLRQKEGFLERDRQRRLLDPHKGIERAIGWAKRHPKEVSIIMARCQQKLKTEVLAHYAIEGVQCVLCGEKRRDCLSIDHINNDGYAHRKELIGKPGTTNFYRWLISQGFPDGYQVLCMNCQWVKAAEYRHQRRLSSK